MKKQNLLKKLLCGITVSGECYTIIQLSAKFQVKCRDFGISDEESLAFWYANEPANLRFFFKPKESKVLIKSAIEKFQALELDKIEV